jgi:hypothetical protein
MKLYDKLNNIKYELTKETIKKSAKNAFAGFSYSTLTDILPHVVKLNHKYKVYMVFDIKEKEGTLKLINVENTDEFIISHMRLNELDKIDLPKMNKLQSLGSKVSYLKRYLITNLYDISSDEDVDSFDTTGVKKKPVRFQPNIKKKGVIK